LKLDVSKTKPMLVSQKKKLLTLIVMMGDTEKFTPTSIWASLFSQTYLGPGTWIKHAVERSTSWVSCIVTSIKPTVCLSRLYQFIVLPILEYGAYIWGPHHKSFIRQIERVLEFAAKIATRPGSVCRQILQEESLIHRMCSHRIHPPLCSANELTLAVLTSCQNRLSSKMLKHKDQE